MNKVIQQTKQAFLFSLAFYILSLILLLFKVGFAPILLSIAMLVSLIWVVLVLREIMLSTSINNTERMMIALFVIVLNIVGGIVYFSFLRNSIIEKPVIKKK
ncbi:hypothetical protein GQF61_08140 [Sphingobacterium sp. DK4209]|uniref:Uncharacterized protein n=1 Tax=Sphingobacterium zhuxiongii TaxID=2662364 RepID=A0A5Q0QC85_9SPHI|nr:MULTISPECIES: hypothetical protein [unclassified Sphingobacterium]MVZ65826.1 hypothetical protein [Sphingobacterium sp. DK4209]QGA24830.1 hypothetical protein GFH32_00135 [Sphingobacterium sp. dk4302]